MSINSRIEELRHQLRVRKHNREHKRRLHQGHRARREARAVRKLRHRINALIALATAPTTMYDAVTISNIPHNAKAVAGYVNGNFTTWPSLKAAFPHARRVSIAVNSSANAEVLDIETGDATNADAPGWFHRQKDARPKRKPAFYTMASNAQPLVDFLNSQGIDRSEYRLWTAHWDGKHVCGPHTCGSLRAPADATQWTTHGETVDESVCRPSFWVGRG